MSSIDPHDPASVESADEPDPTESSDASNLHEELTIADKERAAAQDRYLRARADLDNYRKRSEAEITRRVAENRDGLLRDWLEVVDSVEQARRAALEQGDQQLVGGLGALEEQVSGILARHGVQSIGENGESFDPMVHEVVATRPAGDASDGTVIEVVRLGYGLGDHLLRPAQVVVSRSVG
jgi:molecular chaperone GrpE